MAKKIMVLCGSPRVKGNTNTVAHWFAQAAMAAGADVQMVNLATLKLASNGCTCCLGCQKLDGYECVIKDEAGPVLSAMANVDALVFATPVYFYGPTAQLKLVLDRMYCLYKFKKGEEGFDCAIRGKTLAVIATAADGLEGGLGAVKETFEAIAKFSGCQFQSLLVPHAPKDPKDLANNQDLRVEAIEFGTRLAGE
jgi:multimeric flavodoxin WrbA